MGKLAFTRRERIGISLTGSEESAGEADPPIVWGSPMNRFVAGGLAGGLAMALSVVIATAADPKAAESQSWSDRILGKKTDGKKTEDKPAEKAKLATPMRPPIIIAPLSAEVLAEAVKDEQNACTRRLDVCAKLREIAAANNDEAMLSRIDELERQAVEICQARVARMGIRGSAARSVRSSSETPPTPFDSSALAPPVPVAGGSR